MRTKLSAHFTLLVSVYEILKQIRTRGTEYPFTDFHPYKFLIKVSLI